MKKPTPMRWIEAQVIFDTEENELAAELIADIFYGMGLQGVIIRLPEPDSDVDWADDAPRISGPPAVCGFFAEGAVTGAFRENLEKALEQLKKRTGIQSRVLFQSLDDEDWAESWKANFHAERITPRIVVKPTWEKFKPEAGDIILELDPGMAFGTGSHATTAMCITLIEKHIKSGDRILDVGTGSGILLLAAAKLGAGMLQGIDSDPTAISVAENNLLYNGVARNSFTLKDGELFSTTTGKFNVIVANILSEVVLDILDEIDPFIVSGGIFICSGIIERNAGRVEDKMVRKGFRMLDKLQREDWMAFAGRFDPNSI